MLRNPDAIRRARCRQTGHAVGARCDVEPVPLAVARVGEGLTVGRPQRVDRTGDEGRSFTQPIAHPRVGRRAGHAAPGIAFLSRQHRRSQNQRARNTRSESDLLRRSPPYGWSINKSDYFWNGSVS